MSTQPQYNKIKVANPPLEDNVRTYLTNDIVAGVVSLPILSKRGFFKNDRIPSGEANDFYYIVIGNYGDEKSEIVKATADNTDNKVLVCEATSNSHSASDPVTFIQYNQLKFYGAETSGGTKTLLTTLEIDMTQQYTEYVYKGTEYNFFVSTYYSEAKEEESAYSDEISTGTFTRMSARRIIESGLRKAMTQIDESLNSVLNWDIGLEILQDGVDEIIARKRKWQFLRKDNTGTTVINTAYISKPSDLAQLEFIIIGGYKLHWVSPLRYNEWTEAGVTASTGNPRYYTEKNNKYYLYPTPSSALDVKYEYFKVPEEIDSLIDQIDLPFKSILIYYCASQFAYIRGNDKRGDKCYQMFVKLLEQQAEEYSGPMQSGDAEEIEQTSIYANDEF